MNTWCIYKLCQYLQFCSYTDVDLMLPESLERRQHRFNNKFNINHRLFPQMTRKYEIYTLVHRNCNSLVFETEHVAANS